MQINQRQYTSFLGFFFNKVVFRKLKQHYVFIFYFEMIVSKLDYESLTCNEENNIPTIDTAPLAGLV